MDPALWSSLTNLIAFFFFFFSFKNRDPNSGKMIAHELRSVCVQGLRSVLACE